MLTLDASWGEGGGQVLRTALALSVALERPVTLEGVRIRRPRPGLQPQHLAVVRALGEISDARIEGDALDSTRVSFAPRRVRGGGYTFDVGAVRASAGSVSLLLQALLLPLSLAPEPSRLRLVGGTHVPWSPPVHYLDGVFLPALRHVGLEVEIELARWGWYPRGGGEVLATIRPTRGWRGLQWATSPARPVIAGVSAVSNLPASIALRQQARARERLAGRGLDADIRLVEAAPALGPGTFLFLSAAGPQSLAGFSALGRRGLRAEAVADQAVDPLLAYLDSGAALDDHLADQILAFLAFAGEPSAFTCPSRSRHLETVAWVVRQFLPVRLDLHDGPPARVEVAPAGSASARS